MKAFASGIAVLALAAGMPAMAQTAPGAPVTGPAAAAVDPARLAAARPVIDQIWPLGTYERIMRAAMDQVMSGTMANMYDMSTDEFAKAIDPKAPVAPSGKTFRQMLAEDDPYFEERTRRTMKVMTDEMIVLMTEVEPEVRVALADSYARRFSVAQLDDLHAFFATPTGRIYARESMLLMMGPDMMKAMQAFVPRMMQRMPAIMQKVEAATRDLPPPKRKKTG